MQDREEYIKLNDYITVNNLSASDVRDMTKQQVAAVIDIASDAKVWSDGNEGFFTNLQGKHRHRN